MALPERTKLRRTVREGSEATSAWRRDEGRCCRGRGGAGGLLGAYHAAHAGLEVLLLDQHESRQDRADGDALFPRAVAEVSLMGLADWLERPNYYKYEGIVVYARTAHLCEPNSPTNRHGVRGYVIPWHETATRLLERAREAGTTFRGGVRARSLLRSALSAVSGVEVGEYGPGGAAPRGETMRHEAPLAIVADGAGDFAGDEGTNKLRATASRGGSTARGLTAPRRTTCTFYSPTL